MRYQLKTYEKSGSRYGQVVNSKTKCRRPEWEQTNPDDPEDYSGPDSPVIPRDRVVEPDVGVRGVQEDLGAK